MQLPADILLALRYLRPKRTFVSVITLLSLVGPALGVAILIIVTAVMSGFDEDIRNGILSVQAHLYVNPAVGEAVIRDPGPVLEALRREGVEGAPVIDGPVLIQVRNSSVVKAVKGIVPELEKRVTNIGSNEQFEGRFEIGEGEALIGSMMAMELGLHIGDDLLIHAPQRLTGNIQWQENGEVRLREPDEVYVPEEVRIVGIFSMGVYEFDMGILFLHLDQAADLFGYDWGDATSIHARVPDPFRMDALLDRLRLELEDMPVRSWQEVNALLFGALRVEKTLMVFLLTFIVVVASFGIAGTLITVAVQKTREIGVLKAMGMSGAFVARIFLMVGGIIGLIGTFFGMTLGLLVIHYRNAIADVLSHAMGVDVFPPELYHLTRIPGKPMPGDLILIVVTALVICELASLIPALYASAMSPARALQEEN
ncbi:MAG: ABC transporter permease [Lentisphaeria bacterium]|nr:ABC transporter permease [Lentisphaeria bacterium]